MKKNGENVVSCGGIEVQPEECVELCGGIKPEGLLEDCGGIKPEGLLEDCGGIPFKVEPNKDTELVFIIDRSGSMSGFEEDTIGGFNSMIEKQKKGEGDVFVTTVLFDNFSQTIHDRLPIGQIEPMTEREYFVRGSTALLDAVGQTVEHIKTIHKYIRPEDVPAHTIFVITTDGMENASRKFSRADVKKMISEQTEKCGWEFIFIGANIDSIEAADSIGIRRERAANYSQTRDGIARCYDAMSDFICLGRYEELDEFDESWKKALTN